jgi:hypothetical protein
MEQDGDLGQGVRMVLAGTVSALVVAALTIAVGRALIADPLNEPPARSSPLILVSR